MTSPSGRDTVARRVSQRIAEVSRDFSQKQIAQIAGLDLLTPSAIRDGKARLPFENVVKLARALSIDVGGLLHLQMEEEQADQLIADTADRAVGATSNNGREAGLAVDSGLSLMHPLPLQVSRHLRLGSAVDWSSRGSPAAGPCDWTGHHRLPER